jgi:hypothetical protein
MPALAFGSAGSVRLFGVLPVLAQDAVDRFLRRVDDGLPGRIEGFYVVRSASFGAFRPTRSDLDFVALSSGELTRAELDRLRGSHRRSCAEATRRSLVSVPPRWPLICNGIYVRWEDLPRSPLGVLPIASQVAQRFTVGSGFDVNPVTWCTLAQRGIPVRGPRPSELEVHHDDAELREWTLSNLQGYWGWWADAVRGRGHTATLALLRRFAAWGVLGAPRLHFTLHTGQIATKEMAAQHALEVFLRRWHRIVQAVVSSLCAALRRRASEARMCTANQAACSQPSEGSTNTGSVVTAITTPGATRSTPMSTPARGPANTSGSAAPR